MLYWSEEMLRLWEIASFTQELLNSRYKWKKSGKFEFSSGKSQGNVREFCYVQSVWILPVWSVSSLCAQWVAKVPSFLHADSEDSDQTGRMPKLGAHAILLVLSWGGSVIEHGHLPLGLYMYTKLVYVTWLVKWRKKFRVKVKLT